jgi:8-oxo-dGTP pyrophosphatase MutT (NUDIX family)
MVDFNKVGLLVVRDSRLLLCRKHNLASKLILPGGCIEPGETPDECLIREIGEELGDVALENLEYVGIYLDEAASDDPTVHKTVEIELHRGEIIGSPVASSEIVELVWFGPESDMNELSPILVNKILPDLIERKLVIWDQR